NDGKTPVAERAQLSAELQEKNGKYLRLYAEFDNYKKRVSKDKEELIKYSNESLLYEILPFIDHLEMALKHASNEVSSGLVQGVEITLRDLRKTLEKFGLTAIEADGKPFDPVVHHAMSQVERNDTENNTVVEEFRRGYMLRDKVLRPALVAVSKKTVKSGEQEETEINKNIEEEY
ncbi:MAG: nucleotide exchange factor GrpE, partial [Nitrospira sp.]|nr:nucleotide exchange factor GrpE [Nitrospira sp.]